MQVTKSCPSHSAQYNDPNNDVWCYSFYSWLVRKRNASTYTLWYMFPLPSKWFNDLSVIFLRWLVIGKKSLKIINLSSTAWTLFTDSRTVQNKDYFHLHQQNQDQYTKKYQTYTDTWQNAPHKHNIWLIPHVTNPIKIFTTDNMKLLTVSTPLLYHSSIFEKSFCFSGCGRWCFKVGPLAPKYHGAEDIYCGIWGLMSFPSSSTAAGAVPAYRK